MLGGRRIMGGFLGENGAACRQLHVPIDRFSEHVSRVEVLVRLAFPHTRSVDGVNQILPAYELLVAHGKRLVSPT